MISSEPSRPCFLNGQTHCTCARIAAAPDLYRARLLAESQKPKIPRLEVRRQVWLGDYIVDFVCMEHRLIVELDGGQHAQTFRDERRDEELRRRGFHVIRYWDTDVLRNLDGVLTDLAARIGRARTESPD